jgi:multidrug resistance protein
MEKSDNLEAGTGAPARIPPYRLVFNKSRITTEVETHNYDGKGTAEEPFVVTWIPNDPGNPMTLNKAHKWAIVMLHAFATLIVALDSSAYSGTFIELTQEFRRDSTIITLGVSLFVLGFAIGPLLWAPLSELYGRQIVFLISYGGFAAFNAGSAGSNNIESLLLCRLFAGIFGSSPFTNAGGVIADVFSASERGLAMAIFALCPSLGPTIGPLVGGFLGMNEGWRWVLGLMAILSGFAWIAISVSVPETYAPVILRARAKELSKRTGKVYKTSVDIEAGEITVGQAFRTAIARPFQLLFLEPIVVILSLYMAIVYGTLYLLFGAFPIVFQGHRGWSEGISGLAFMGVGLGMMVGIPFFGYLNKAYSKAAEGGKQPDPEMRLPPAMIGAFAIPIGMFWFAWTNGSEVHWMAPIAAGVPFGFGMLLVFLSVTNYLVDAYTIFAASALAANAVLRSLFGAAFPLFTRQMYNSLGIHWASSVPAFLAVGCIPFPFLIAKYGPAIRKRCRYAAEAAAFRERLVRKEVVEDGVTVKEEVHEVVDEDRRSVEGLYRVVTATYEASPFDVDRVNTVHSEVVRSNTVTSRK